jgi:hypothetical protein
MMKATILASLAGFAQGEDMCCQTCADGLQKYYSVDMKHGHCGEACIKPSKFGLFKVFESNLTIADGSTGYSSCADLGWPKYSETVTHGDPFGLLSVTLDLYDHNDAVASSETCHLYEISGDTCGQSDLDCTYTGPAKTFRKTLLDGTCAEHGYTVKTGEQTMSVPVIGDISVTTYSQGATLASGDTCSLYEISGDTCGQSDLDCTYTGPAKAFRKTLADGTCADQGYTVKTGEQTMSVPVIGDISVTQYSKGATLASGETCSLYEISGDTCGQSDLDCTYTGPAKTFRRTLLDGTCAEHGYSVQTGEQTMSVPVIGDIKVTMYSKGLMLV